MISRTDTTYPGIKKAALEIAYDNGAVNRGCTEEAVLKRLDDFLTNNEEIDLKAIDEWLEGLEPEALNILCCGDSGDIAHLVEQAPIYTEALLNNWFDFM